MTIKYHGYPDKFGNPFLTEILPDSRLVNRFSDCNRHVNQDLKELRLKYGKRSVALG